MNSPVHLPVGDIVFELQRSTAIHEACQAGVSIEGRHFEKSGEQYSLPCRIAHHRWTTLVCNLRGVHSDSQLYVLNSADCLILPAFLPLLSPHYGQVQAGVADVTAELRTKSQSLAAFQEKPGHHSSFARAQWAATEFSLAPDRTTIGRILNYSEKYSPTADLGLKKARVMVNPALDRALADWVLQCQQQKLAVSNGWLQSFCSRHSFRQFKIYGESGSAPVEGYEEQLARIKERILPYDVEDVYNMDETGLFYNLAPDKTLARRQIEGMKKDKTRLKVALTANATGSDRYHPVFTGHAKMPRCFERKTAHELGFIYFNNKKAWMTGLIFQDFLRGLKQHTQRKILLLIDNCPAHIWNATDFPDIEVLELPLNTTSKFQPMDAGIIATMKLHHRRRQLANALILLDLGKSPYKVRKEIGTADVID